MNIDKQYLRGLTLTLAAVLVLSPDALLVRLIAADAWTLLFWRGLLAGITLTIALVTIYRQQLIAMFRASGRLGLLSALVAAIGSIFFVCSLRQTTVANTLVILAATPLLAALFSRLFLGETIQRRTWVAISSAFIGVLVIFSGSLASENLVGDLFAVCASCSWAGNLVIVRRARPLNMVPANAFGNLLIAPFALLFGAKPFAIVPEDILLLLILGVLVLPISYALISLAPRLLQAPEVSLTLLLETLLGPFWVWLVINEQPAKATIGGGVLILGTLIIHTLISMRIDSSRQT